MYPLFKARMLKTYPQEQACIDAWLPVGFASADAGIAGAVTSLASITASLKANPQHWARRARQWSRMIATSPIHRRLYEHALYEGAELLFSAWHDSDAARGWVVVEIEPSEMYSAQGMLRRARELANLMPNIMVSVPLSEMGCEVIEELVATGHAVNASLCFSVAQLQAGLAAIRRGRLRALSHGVNLQRTRHLISIIPAGIMAHGPELSAQEQRWAEIALCQALSAAMLGQGESTRLMISGFGSFSQWAPVGCESGSGKGGLLHSVSASQFERLIAACGRSLPDPSHTAAPLPAAVLERLLQIADFRQLWGADDLAPGWFARHPVFMRGMARSVQAYTELLGFARHLNAPLLANVLPISRPISMGRH